MIKFEGKYSDELQIVKRIEFACTKYIIKQLIRYYLINENTFGESAFKYLNLFKQRI